MIPEE